MNWSNFDDVLRQLLELGLEVTAADVRDSVTSNRPRRRCTVQGMGKKKRGWYQLYDNSIRGESYITGSFGYFSGSDCVVQIVGISKDAKSKLSPDDIKAMQAMIKAAKKKADAERKAEIQRAAQRARVAWGKASEVGSCSYLTRKAVGGHGVRYSKTQDVMVIPAVDANWQICGLQIIRGEAADGKLSKEFWPAGMQKKGTFHVIGSPRAGEVILEVEGYATGATIYEATGLPVIVAWDAGNLPPVAEVIAKIYPGAKIAVCAEDDYLQKCNVCNAPTNVALEKCQHCDHPHQKNNPGVTAAKNAAMAVGGITIIPEFPTDRGGKKINDFNDLQHDPAGGLAAVRQQIETALHQAGWLKPKSVPPVAHPTGGGGRKKRPAAVSVMDLGDLIDRFIPVDDGKGRAFFDSWRMCLADKQQVLELKPAGIQWDDIKRDPAYRARGGYYIDEVGFDPTEKDERVKCNLWNGWLTEPVEGDCIAQLRLLEYLCSGDKNADELFRWVLRWLAYPIQNPGAKMQSALVIHGPQGSGKSTVFESVAAIYDEYARVFDQDALEDKFNADWSRCLYVIADEVVSASEKFSLKNKLKMAVTGKNIRINPKGVTAHSETNHMNFVFLSNEYFPVVLEGDDRRHCVIWTPPKLDYSYYVDVREEINNGGIAALHHFLLNLDLADFDPYAPPPMTVAKSQLIDISRPSIDTFFKLWQENDLGELSIPYGPCTGTSLYKAYKKWCVESGERFPRPRREMTAWIEKHPGWVSEARTLFKTYAFDPKQAVSTRYVMPSPEAMNESLRYHARVEYVNGQERRAGDMREDTIMATVENVDTTIKWKSYCCLKFDDALKNHAAEEFAA